MNKKAKIIIGILSSIIVILIIVIIILLSKNKPSGDIGIPQPSDDTNSVVGIYHTESWNNKGEKATFTLNKDMTCDFSINKGDCEYTINDKTIEYKIYTYEIKNKDTDQTEYTLNANKETCENSLNTQFKGRNYYCKQVFSRTGKATIISGGILINDRVLYKID